MHLSSCLGHTSAGHVVNCAVPVGCASSLEIPLASAGGVPQTLTLFGGVRFIAWLMRFPSLGECRRGPRHFWDCRTRLGYGPSTGPTKKRPCATLVRLVGRIANTRTVPFHERRITVKIVCLSFKLISLSGYFLWLASSPD